MLFSSRRVEFNVGIGRNSSDRPQQAARDAVAEARAGLTRDEALCLTFLCGRSPTNTDVVAALSDELGPECPVFGGAAGRHTSEAAPPKQFYQGEVLSDAVPVLLMAGDVPFGFAISNSWDPVGRRTCITEAEGRVVRRIGDMKALDYYRHYLGNHTEPATEFPLAVFEGDSDKFYTRVPVRYDEDAASITFGAPMAEGADVQLSETAPPRMLAQLQESAMSARQMFGDADPAAALVFSCNARKGILGSMAASELDAVRQTVSDYVPILGFYGFAEFAPLQPGDPSLLHHSTMITVMLGDAAEPHSTPEPVLDDTPNTMDETQALRQEVAILRKKLKRSEHHRRGLEQLRDSNDALLRKVNDEIEEARESLAKEKEKSERLLLNILPVEIAEELKRSGAVEPVFYPCASVLFTEFKGFTRVARNMTPKQLVDELDFFFSAFDRIIERYGLEKLKTIGDAYMCAGGIPRGCDDHTVRIVNAAWDIHLFMEQLKRRRQARGEPFWELRCGVHAGPLMAGVIGKKKFAYDIWGDAVNIASRLESGGEAGKVNISKEVYELVKGDFDCEHRGQIPIKNRGEIDMYFVTGRRRSLRNTL